jgi:hypothetical protein
MGFMRFEFSPFRRDFSIKTQNGQMFCFLNTGSANICTMRYTDTLQVFNYDDSDLRELRGATM